MIKLKQRITNNQLDVSSLKENILSIQLSLDGFSFCIHEGHTNELLAVGIYEIESDEKVNPINHLKFFEAFYNDEVLMHHDYKRIDVSHSNNLVSQVPTPFFNKNNLNSYLNYSVKLLDNDYITYDELTNSEIVNVYIPFVNINNFLIDKFGAFTFKHSSTVLIENLMIENKNRDGDYCFVNVRRSSFDLIVFKNKQFTLYNSFSFKTKEDFIYHILFVAEQLNLNPETFQLELLGEIEKESELYTICYQYIRNVSFYKNDNYLKGFKELSKHSNFVLLHQ